MRFLIWNNILNEWCALAPRRFVPYKRDAERFSIDEAISICRQENTKMGTGGDINAPTYVMVPVDADEK